VSSPREGLVDREGEELLAIAVTLHLDDHDALERGQQGSAGTHTSSTSPTAL
jgi:hypothetical protein